jgi:hypothetical protein
MSRKVFWIFFLTTLAVTLGLKVLQTGWFAPRPPLELDGKPVLLFFNKARGCECELLVYNNAQAQMDVWQARVQSAACADPHLAGCRRQTAWK